MKTRTFHPNLTSEAGLTLVEILIAMMVFAIVALGVAYGLASSLLLGSDARSRETATNLAAAEVDLGQSADDVFTVVDRDSTVALNGTTFRLHRSTNWVTSASGDASCGSGGGQLRYKRLNVTVTWDGMRASTSPVRADTVIAPGNRINDPLLGTILVSVLTGTGSGSSGVTVTATPGSPANGAQPLSVTPLPTDAQGCSYILKVKPGNYDVTISRPNSLDIYQMTSPVRSVGVAAGAAASVAFDYDTAGVFTVSYGSHFLPAVLQIPRNLDTSFRRTTENYSTANTTSALTRDFSLYPFAAGYEIFAGKYVEPNTATAGCLSVDPARWSTPAPDGALGRAPARVAASPGGGVATGVPMGIVAVNGLAGKYLKAVSQVSAPGTGDPGCAETMTYLVDPLTSAAAPIGLPYGSWLLYTGDTAAAQTVPVPPASLTVLTRGSPVAASGMVTLDPRVVIP